MRRAVFLAAGLFVLITPPLPAQDAKQEKQKWPQPYAHPPDVADVSYGPHQRNVLDIWKATSDRPTPLVVYYHPGGFTLGDKTMIPKPLLETCLKRGISVASANYRYAFQEHYPGPMADCVRALQYLRLHAKEWNFDPKAVAVTGASAGAGMSLWIGFHEDMADPKSDDPVKRESTRVSVVGSSNGQTSYDPRVVAKLIDEKTGRTQALATLFGVPKGTDPLTAEKFFPLYEDGSPITHLKAGAPPVFMIYAAPEKPLAETPAPEMIHNFRFGKMLKEQMDKLGIECALHYSGEFGNDPNQVNGEMVSFFQKHFPPAGK